jgi:hypothetical protein
MLWGALEAVKVGRMVDHRPSGSQDARYEISVDPACGMVTTTP